MATSGSTTFNLTAYEIVEEMYDLIGARAEGETLSDSEYTKGLRILNLLTTSWQSQSIGLWLEQEVTLYLKEEARSYSLGLTGDHCSATVIEDVLSASAAADATSIAVTSTTCLEGGVFLGIELDDGELDWHEVSTDSTGTIYFDTNDADGICTSQKPSAAGNMTINGALADTGVVTLDLPRKVTVTSAADDSARSVKIEGTDANGNFLYETLTVADTGIVSGSLLFKTITIAYIDGAAAGNLTVGIAAGGLTSAASSGNAVFSYETKIDRPLEVLEARYVDGDDNEIRIELLSWSEYQGLVDKDDAGSVLKACYRPLLDNGKFYTWPVCSDVSARIKMTNKVPIDNLVSQPDTVHFPSQWLDAIIWNGAVDLAPRCLKRLDAWFIGEAKRKKAHAMLGDSPRTGIKFTPYTGR